MRGGEVIIPGRLASVLGLTVCLLFVSSRNTEAACTLSATGVAFGNYNVFTGAAVDSTGSVTYNCDNTTHDIVVTLSTGSSGTYTGRTLRSGANQLTYNLYTDAARTLVWGDGTGGTDMYSKHNPQNNRDVSITIYGRIAAGQDAAVGTYTDSVTATVNF